MTKLPSFVAIPANNKNLFALVNKNNISRLKYVKAILPKRHSRTKGIIFALISKDNTTYKK